MTANIVMFNNILSCNHKETSYTQHGSFTTFNCCFQHHIHGINEFINVIQQGERANINYTCCLYCL